MSRLAKSCSFFFSFQKSDQTFFFRPFCLASHTLYLFSLVRKGPKGERRAPPSVSSLRAPAGRTIDTTLPIRAARPVAHIGKKKDRTCQNARAKLISIVGATKQLLTGIQNPARKDKCIRQSFSIGPPAGSDRDVTDVVVQNALRVTYCCTVL